MTIEFSRRELLHAFAITTVCAAPLMSAAPALARGAGNIRQLKMYSGRTGEHFNSIYWIDGEYISEVVTQINHFMRDWRNGQTHDMDLRTIDIMAASHALLGIREPYLMLSGYRSPQTNNMLRQASIKRNGGKSGVAKNSLHMKGLAADLRLKSRSVGQMTKAALACHSGGVGTYPRSNFVHMDCGPVRAWKGK